MPLSLVPYTSEWERAALEFNRRGRAAQAPVDFLLPEAASPVQYLVTDGGMVRGGVLVEVEPGWVGTGEAAIASVQSPLSEGLWDPQYAGVSPWLVREVARRWPHAYSVGMGGLDKPYPRLVQALRWKVLPVPFFFRVLHGGRFLRGMPAVRSKPGMALAGSVPLVPSWAFRLLHVWKAEGATPPGAHPFGLETVGSFSQSDLSQNDTAAWEAVRPRLTFAVSRDGQVLNGRYGGREGMRLARFDGGFLVLKVRQFSGDRYFGNLRVAVWADGLAEPGKEAALVCAAERLAANADADLLVTNQLYAPLQAALRGRGWLSFASNFLVAWSPAIAAVAEAGSGHVTRRDGDGLISL